MEYLLKGLNYKFETEITDDYLIKIKEHFLNKTHTSIIDLKEKAIQEALAKMGYVKQECHDDIKINPDWMGYIEKGCKFPKWLEKILDFKWRKNNASR